MQFLYLFISLFLGRRNPLYFLLFPFAMVSGPGVFIDPRTVLVGVDIFTFGKNIYKDVIIIYLIFVIIYLSSHYKIKVFSKSPMMAYAFYILILILLTIVESGIMYNGISIIRLFLYMILGFFLLKSFFYVATSKQIIDFFNTIFWVTGVLSIFYVLNSSKVISIYYQENMYSEIESGQASFYRDFSTVPYLGHFLFILAFSTKIMKSRLFNTWAVNFVLLTYPFVLLYTFTRSLLIATAIELFLITAIVIFMNFSKVLRLSIFLKILAIFILSGYIISVFSNEFEYFGERINSAKNQGAKEQNVLIRLNYLVSAYEIIENDNSLFFGGGLNKKHEDKMNQIGAWSVDSTIPFLLIYTGIVGVFFYYFLGLYYLRKIGKLLMLNLNPFTLALFAIILMALMRSLIMGGYRWGDPFIFYTYVLVEVLYNLKTRSKIQKKLQELGIENVIKN